MLEAHTLETKTQVYWNLSKSYNGRSRNLITAEYAFRQINNVLICTESNRKLSKLLVALRVSIVKGPELEDALNMTANQ